MTDQEMGWELVGPALEARLRELEIDSLKEFERRSGITFKTMKGYIDGAAIVRADKARALTEALKWRADAIDRLREGRHPVTWDDELARAEELVEQLRPETQIGWSGDSADAFKRALAALIAYKQRAGLDVKDLQEEYDRWRFRQGRPRPLTPEERLAAIEAKLTPLDGLPDRVTRLVQALERTLGIVLDDVDSPLQAGTPTDPTDAQSDQAQRR